MTVARRLVPGQVHTTTRRVTRRAFLLLPTKAVNAIVRYCLVYAASRHGVSVFAYCAISNHNHGKYGDTLHESRLSDFQRDMNSLTARALNSYWGRGENFWSAPGSFDNCEVHGELAIEEQLLYVWTQPVAAGLVATPEEWPGVILLPEDFGRTITADRPDRAFFGGRRPAGWEPTYPRARAEHRRVQRLLHERAERRARSRARRKAKRKGRPVRPGRSDRTKARKPKKKERATRPPRDRRRLPKTVSITIPPPPGYEDWPIEDVRAHFRKLLDERVAEIHVEREAEGLTHFMGVAAVLAQDPFDTAGPTAPDFGLNPRVACRDTILRVRVLNGLQAWRSAYRAALLRWRDGDREVCFPYGSYALPRYHGALVEHPAQPTGPPAAA